LRFQILYYETLYLVHATLGYPWLYDLAVRVIRPSALIPSATPFYFEPAAGGYIRFQYQNVVAAEHYGVDQSFSIPRAGNIFLLDDKFIQIGKDSDGTLPTASADYRGKMIRVEGGMGEGDKLYVCMKKADDTYAWVQVANG